MKLEPRGPSLEYGQDWCAESLFAELRGRFLWPAPNMYARIKRTIEKVFNHET